MKDVNLKINSLKDDLEEYISLGSVTKRENQKTMNDDEEKHKLQKKVD